MKPALIPWALPATISDPLHIHVLNTGPLDIGKGADAGEEQKFISGNGSRAGARYNSSIGLRSATNVKI